MIFSNLHARKAGCGYPAAIVRALEYLEKQDFSKMEPGEYEIEGRKMFGRVMDMELKERKDARPETHRKYIDLQYWISGEELVGFCPDMGDCEIAEEAPAHDIYFWGGLIREEMLKAAAGDYMIFFPNDIHRPGIKTGQSLKSRKIVIKLSVDLL